MKYFVVTIILSVSMDVRWLLRIILSVGLHLHVCVCAGTNASTLYDILFANYQASVIQSVSVKGVRIVFSDATMLDTPEDVDVVLEGLCVCAGTNASTLYDTLFANYQPTVIPKCNSSEAVQVKVGLALRQVIDLNEPRQILESNTWVRLIWKDCQLTWNATETGIDNLVVPNNAVWVPDITLYDNAQNALGGLTDYRPSIYPDGTVYYNFPSVIKSLCRVDVTYFPFDTQICKLQFGSWSYHGLDLNVTKRDAAGDTSVYISNGEWTILGIPSIRHELYYACCVEPYPDITFYIQLERKPLFYLLNLLFPCSLISTMGFLGFLLPPDSGEKVSLEITVLLSLAVFLLVVSETMPPTSETFPFIGVYFAMAMLLVSCSCLMTVTVLNLHFKGHFGKRMPPWVRKVFLDVLGNILCVKRQPNSDWLKKNKVSDVHDIKVQMQSQDDLLQNDHLNHENNLNKSITELKELSSKQLNVRGDYTTSSTELLTLLQKQQACLTHIKAYMDERTDHEAVVTDWQKLAQVIDRVFMVIFIVIQIITTLVILIKITTAETPLDVE